MDEQDAARGARQRARAAKSPVSRIAKGAGIHFAYLAARRCATGVRADFRRCVSGVVLRCVSGAPRAGPACVFRSSFLRRSYAWEVTMNVFSYRKHLRFLSRAQRRLWWDQKKRLTPRVKIGEAYVPPSITREFTYVKVG
ncbi:hypothetical protein C0Z19_04805 [Trinickia soli]|uniref:Uncharacterized protein n=2 Tax=Burkholderiaceae TaxID=119060 RepID=A0A2N7WCH1_9BURK|nr:hypothetical protein CIW54_09460 [Paraburkholderia sp. T12-10]PMS27084.1 hypothetical protein C0Z19_04805 [Trinickia soli]